MAKHLMIVESPSKAKTIQSYLGKDYKVIATVGHIIDLPTSKLGVDVENNYEPEYTVIKGKDKVIKELKQEVKKTEGKIYLSPDPDREGESIAWQVVRVCDLKPKSYERVVFHEVTKPAIQDAIDHARKIDEDLVQAQQGRRILDRLVGYPLSQLLWKKVKYGLSAGRVQSVALRLIAEREDEIKAFIPQPYLLHDVTYTETGEELIFRLSTKKGDLYKMTPEFQKEVGEHLQSQDKHTVVGYFEKDKSSTPSAPFTTSKLQQNANRRFGFTAKQTMSIAQELYQGINIGDSGMQGLITYMRTDSTTFSEVAIEQIRKWVTKEYGKEYLNDTVRRYKTKAKVAQEAHEAIRPTHIEYAPEKIAKFLTPQQLKLYTMIWQRAVATQMKPAVIREKKLITVPQDKKLNEVFSKEKIQYQVSAEEIIFKGYSLVEKYSSDKPVLVIPQLKSGDSLTVEEYKVQELMTTPKSRYNDASLVKELEKRGIGRPSTYASIISTLVTREYVKREEKSLWPTDTGMLVAKFLIEFFPQIVDYDFTAKMEDELDKIVSDKIEKEKMLDDFYPAFIKDIAQKEKTISKDKLTDLGETEKPCPKCEKLLHMKIGPYGKYYACFTPDCGHTEPFIDEEKYHIPEEVTKEGYVLKKSRFGSFWAHPGYPEIKKTLPLLLKDVCPECGKHLVERRAKTGRYFVGCSGYPNCKYIANANNGRIRKGAKTKKVTTRTRKK
ncbi:MAG: type I DNA topoisomerase [Candidatus Dojkabacteria bacterium]|nr:MAG: type I DNA topoisomerase [Candidatus Dojkabacteria bacterium]